MASTTASSSRAPPPRDDISDSGSDVSSDSSAGWTDAPDAENEVDDAPAIVCLFCAETYPSAAAVFAHCKESHDFDFAAHARDLEFYDRIKLVNYVRSCTASGTKPELESKMVFADEKFLQPVLADDALLFSLDELEIPEQQEETVDELRQKLDDLARQFQEYKDAVSKTFTERLEQTDATEEKKGKRDDDTHYFDSYAYNDIHETMLKDTVRTDAYRDFIYGNKELFKDKVVLDVGCGTGVLSMFAAKAGAKKVISVDNSNIIDKARANVFANKLDHVITCLRGKIEEVVLPVDKVDIIVSEWMGYCLLYEAMLDSVLYARDKYLVPDGLMVPSECRLMVAAVHDPEYINDAINFWNDVYGFNMASMKEKIRDEVDIVHMPAAALASEPVPFCHLPLHTIKTQELEFTKPFEVVIKEDIDTLDGFLVYFDNYFMPVREPLVPADAMAETFKDPSGKKIAFTTGPRGKETHWRAGLLVVEEDRNGGAKKGEAIKGEITYKKLETENSRAYEIAVDWVRNGEKKRQVWYMR